ncbi:hypothetical protein [Legionella cardiaca]|uniref:Uncharacterized protein n=1 Tax=Legionella cardiaca TaxID=1071983 RepID=A0ABY8AUI6_9GAMM|nr:hypothetical protein [Legionella cardiaca]WED43180.1 hypothetical protein PXX05_15000 [Legionella cardiaca]
MKISLNPFFGIIETRNTPHARTLRTSLTTKFKDAFSVFSGSKGHWGLFDYPTLFLAAAAIEFLRWCLQNKANNKLAFILLIPAAIINIPLYIVRLAVAGLATFITAPITLLVHAIASHLSRKTKEEALSLRGKTPEGSYVTLNDLLTQKNIDLEDLLARVKKVEKEQSTELHLEFAQVKTNDEGNTEISPIKEYDVQVDLTQKRALSSFFKLNIGKIVTLPEAKFDSDTADKYYNAFTKV